MSNWEEFFASNNPPSDFNECKEKIQSFCGRHNESKIVLVTSGGTTVPLEHNTVRFVDNFSAGTRGAASAEYFINQGYFVIFLYRLKSLEPFVRHFMGQQLLDNLVIKELDSSVGKAKVEVSEEYTSKVLHILYRYQRAMKNDQLLCIGFTTLSDYLWLLRETCQQLAKNTFRTLVYLAAAVSDFYIPAREMPQHKIQSREGAPKIQLQLVPKMLAPLVTRWVPYAYVVSFKLETDPDLLIPKARKALDMYKHKLVIGNILNTRKYKVTLVEATTQHDISLTEREISSGLEIEEKIVEHVSSIHQIYIEGLTNEGV